MIYVVFRPTEKVKKLNYLEKFPVGLLDKPIADIRNTCFSLYLLCRTVHSKNESMLHTLESMYSILLVGHTNGMSCQHTSVSVFDRV